MESTHSGTVYLSQAKTVLIPAPTSDPEDPLNLPKWQKSLVVLNLSLFSAISLALLSGLGGILNLYEQKYSSSGYNPSNLVNLMVLPILTIGAGCLLGLPLSVALGRRAVSLGASVIAVFSIALCATSKNYQWHLAGRMILGLAAGQSEVLIPIMIQECFFLHQRGRVLMIQQAIQTTIATTFILVASPIATALSPEAWYGIGGGFALVQLLLALLFQPNTLYIRPIAAYSGLIEKAPTLQIPTLLDSSLQVENVCFEKPPLNLPLNDEHKWSWKFTLYQRPPNWSRAGFVLKNMFQVLRLPTVWWAILVNGISLGSCVAASTTYGTILSGTPFHWPESSISYANCGQIVVYAIAVPVFGYGSDFLIQWRAKRNNGIHEPEARLIPVTLQVFIGILANTLYGFGSSDTRHYSWFLFVWCLAATNFCFIAVNIVSFTYILDSFAKSGDYMLTVICACRNLLTVGLIHGFMRYLARTNYIQVFSTFAALSAVSGLLHVSLYVWGKKLRAISRLPELNL